MHPLLLHFLYLLQTKYSLAHHQNVKNSRHLSAGDEAFWCTTMTALRGMKRNSFSHMILHRYRQQVPANKV
ncbi:hypothetical protein HanRHA438_Chr15g0700051 [Helianthus annuus]|nr:hypothetical protein HanRHA438_Chr15g0700051 [Helianthus annuus]